MRFRYTPEQLEFLRDGYRVMPARLLTEAFNARFGTTLTHTAIKSALNNHRIRCGRKCGYPKGYRRMFSREQEEFIRAGYRSMPVRELTAALNERFNGSWTVDQVKAYTSRHKIPSGRTGCFPKGHEPANKGIKHPPGWAPGRMAETQFKPDQMPVTTVPVGTEVVDPDGYIKRKISEGGKPGESRFNWKFKHVLVWEEHHRPVPDGHAVIFKNGDKSDVRIENLALVTRAELLYLNRHGLAGAGEEIWPAVEALAKLEVTRFEREHDIGARKRA